MSGPVTLVCLPHAGGGASTFAQWTRLFGPGVEVVRPQLAGHEERAAEPPPRRVADAVAELLAGLDSRRRAGGVAGDECQRGRPAGTHRLALYGHSMGALLAFELARALDDAGDGPEHLFVSGRRAPHRAARRAPLHGRPDDEFLATLVAMGGTPPEVAASPLFRRHALGLVRSDLSLAETWVHRPSAPLHCPVTAFVGHGDPVVDPDEVLAWSEITTGPFAAHHLAGDHFFHQQHRAALAGAMSAALADDREDVPCP